MNFKTTIVLVALLAVAGIAVLFTREKESPDSDGKQHNQHNGGLEIHFGSMGVPPMLFSIKETWAGRPCYWLIASRKPHQRTR